MKIDDNQKILLYIITKLINECEHGNPTSEMIFDENQDVFKITVEKVKNVRKR